MRRQAGIRTVAAGLAGALVLGMSSACAPEPAFEEVVPVVRAIVEAHHAPGAIVAIEVGGERRVLTFGDAAADDRSAYRSITKSFVGTVVLQLAEEGALGLDDPIGEHLPQVRDGDRTIRQLLAMRSGIPNYSAQQAFFDAFGADPLRSWTDEELLELAQTTPADFAAGTRYAYSNTNTVILGMLIEAVTGRSWAEEVHDRIAVPLGLDSVVYPAEPLGEPRLQPFLIEDGEASPAPEVPASAFSGAGGLSGTADDLLSWAQALARGVLLDPATQAERVADPSEPSTDPKSPHYDAYGLAIGELDGWWGHTGNGLGYEALAMADPATGDGIAVLLSASDAADGEIPAEIYEAIRTALAR
ncbi:MAG: beta-lactamase family protein [Microbacteriaceae bacterium]|nr:beta-lactamase family protein [Microbacteriaceae bacterium]